ncbi:MAG TPA: hypothetical protein VMU79_15485 [Casimicrobiaceae bacterium]|jgi:hypothetical protein|nr:hypothetical protein [Casimicrobiaceae bacterium]
MIRAREWRNCAVAIGFLLTVTSGARAFAQAAATPAKPKVYALLAAIGEDFTLVTEVSRTGTHLSPYRRHTEKVAGDVLNRMALYSLDQAITKIDPASARVYMTMPAASMQGVAPSQRAAVAMAKIVSDLEQMPQRLQWDRIVVATPAYKALEANGLGSKLQGFGMFAQSQCQAACGGFGLLDHVAAAAAEPPDGVDAVTSDDQAIKARTFLAPFSYIEVWVLDPKTLAVLDEQESFSSQKLAEKVWKPLDFDNGTAQKYLATRIANLIELSISEAVDRSEISIRRGTVEIGPIREIEPGDAKQ